ncbi:hypothetical protein [Bacillus sp. Marseille-P3661]|nr:hypothetical protein [Bacillus sp. Marseille-P3661]
MAFHCRQQIAKQVIAAGVKKAVMLSPTALGAEDIDGKILYF